MGSKRACRQHGRSPALFYCERPEMEIKKHLDTANLTRYQKHLIRLFRVTSCSVSHWPIYPGFRRALALASGCISLYSFARQGAFAAPAKFTNIRDAPSFTNIRVAPSSHELDIDTSALLSTPCPDLLSLALLNRKLTGDCIISNLSFKTSRTKAAQVCISHRLTWQAQLHTRAYSRH